MIPRDKKNVKFQSTPPMQGATVQLAMDHGWKPVSIHAPYAGSDRKQKLLVGALAGFNPRPLCRERHPNPDDGEMITSVSIHAPYAGSDRYHLRSSSASIGFNPRPLCRERPPFLISLYQKKCSFNPRPLCRERLSETRGTDPSLMFQSTPPMQGATFRECRNGRFS